MNGRFVKDADWTKFLVKIGKYIKIERADKIKYHYNIIATATKRLMKLESGMATTSTPPQSYDPLATKPTSSPDPFATQPVSSPQVAPTDVSALMARLETLERTV